MKNNRTYFRDMNHLRESLNKLLVPNFIASFNFYKREGRDNKITSQLVFNALSYPPFLPKRRNIVSYKQILLKSKYFFPLKSRYLIISKITLSLEFKYRSFTNVYYISEHLRFIFIYDKGTSVDM